MKDFIFITFTGKFSKRTISEIGIRKYKKYYVGDAIKGKSKADNSEEEKSGVKKDIEYIPKYKWNFFMLLESKSKKD